MHIISAIRKPKMHDVMSIGKKSAIVQCVYKYEAPNNGPVVLGNEETH